MKPLLLIALAAFGLGYSLNLPAEEEAGYDLADIRALDELTAAATEPQDWLSLLVAAQKRGGHAQ